MKERHIFPRLAMIQPQDFSADLICTRTPAESDKWAFTSRDRCSRQNHLLPSLLSLHRLLLHLHLHLPPSSIFSTYSAAVSPHKELPNVANGSATKGIGVEMHHLFSLFVKRHLAASNAGELWSWMCVSHRPLSRPPGERVILLLSWLCASLHRVVMLFCNWLFDSLWETFVTFDKVKGNKVAVGVSPALAFALNTSWAVSLQGCELEICSDLPIF